MLREKATMVGGKGKEEKRNFHAPLYTFYFFNRAPSFEIFLSAFSTIVFWLIYLAPKSWVFLYFSTPPELI